MADWNPDLYRRFENERTRPARDLLAAIPPRQARFVVDLGCGPGNSTELLAAHYPTATIMGVDTSSAMLEAAAKRLPNAHFVAADIAAWAPPQPADVIFANAALQWVGQHERLLPRLFDALAPGGVLAIQMPDNRDEPTHRLMRELALDPRWRSFIGEEAASRLKLLSLSAYYDLLAPRAENVEVWRTIYHHPMDDAAAIVSWVRATGLKPFIEPLPADARALFLEAYEAAIEEAYAVRADGRRLLAFPRAFVVARRA